jgi:hypothetical protein
VDAATRNAIADRARDQIRNALLFASASTLGVLGIHAFLAQIGEPAHGMYLFAAPSLGSETPQARIEQLRRLEHEAGHLVERFREERLRRERELPASVPPKAGRFA